MTNLELDVCLDVQGEAVPVGRAWFTQRRRGPVTTVFAYWREYLARPSAFAIDPALPLVDGNQYFEALPGAFQDSAPDRWGRNLIRQRHRLQAPETRELNDVDFLIGVSDRTRQGALRFKFPGEAPFVDPEDRVPRLMSLPRLLRASDRVVDGSDDFEAIKDLLDAGSGSLGGARPKASVEADQGHLLIAKFPHRADEWNVMAWEAVALDLAEAAGIRSVSRDLVDVGGRDVLVLERFDRTPQGHRVPYISAMTVLGATDGDRLDYLDLAEAITDISASTTADLAELYRRAVVNVAIHNTDDHLRNHGFLAAGGGWRLSPVFDLNPDPDVSSTRATSIGGAVRRADEIEGLLRLADGCRLSSAAAADIDTSVAAAVEEWRGVASKRGIARQELDRFEPVLSG